MKIKKIKINGFGKLKNKEIEFRDRINLIEGENESGKTTLLKFIIAMFYGVSRNKNGKLISDFEKYKPWNNEEYSGKIEYCLDNSENYEVFREFKKKSPIIYNNKKEDITKKFTIDKNKENLFFIEQIGVREENFFSTSAVEQEEIKLDKNMKNNIIQKLSNIITTGNETVSYKKSIEKLNKKQLEEIGNDRSSGRPINIIDEELKHLEVERKELEIYEKQKYNINKNKELIESDIIENKNILDLLRRQKKEIEKLEIKKAKINYLDKEIEEINIKIKKENKSEEKSKKNKHKFILPLVIFMTILLIAIFIKKNIILSLEIIPIIFLLINLKKNKKIKYKNNKEIKVLYDALQNKEKSLKEENKKIEDYIKEKEKNIYKDFKNKIKNETIKEILSLRYEKIVEYIDEKEREVADYKIEKKQTEIENELVEKNLEKLIEIEEKINSFKSQRIELNNLNKIYELVKEEITFSYDEIKENITPGFIQELRNILAKVTNNKYRNIYLDNNNEIMIEIENGKYIVINKLSTGTIDLIYLALRISAAKKITNEKMPILLDESFAYFDDNRLKNVILYLYENYDNQIFILSCSNREKKILEDSDIEFNTINL